MSRAPSAQRALPVLSDLNRQAESASQRASVAAAEARRAGEAAVAAAAAHRRSLEAFRAVEAQLHRNGLTACSTETVVTPERIQVTCDTIGSDDDPLAAYELVADDGAPVDHIARRATSGARDAFARAQAARDHAAFLAAEAATAKQFLLERIGENVAPTVQIANSSKR